MAFTRCGRSIMYVRSLSLDSMVALLLTNFLYYGGKCAPIIRGTSVDYVNVLKISYGSVFQQNIWQKFRLKWARCAVCAL